MRVSLRPTLLASAVATFAVAALLGVSGAKAAEPFMITFPAGTACDFELFVAVAGNGKQITRTFTRPDGTVRILSAGTGSDLVFSRPDSDATLSLKGNGAVGWTTISTDGSTRLTLTGHNVVFYFPTDFPAGPSTTLVVGREVIDVDASGNFHRVSETGNTTDICAALSG
jgi:hypothetical protein